MTDKYIPECGDMIFIDFQPQKGREIEKRRPALVLSPKRYNRNGLVLVVPISTGVGATKEISHFKVAIKGKKTKGAILSDQIKNLDWKARNAKKIESVDDDIINEVLGRLCALLGVE